MKKGIFFVFFSLLLCNANSQTQVTYYDNNWKKCEATQARFYSELTKTDSGYLAMDYFIQERQLQMKGLYSDAVATIKNGQFLYFYNNGILKTNKKYVQNKLEGLALGFDKKGELNEYTIYKNNEIDTQYTWHDNGNMKDSIVKNIDNSTTEVIWFENGNLSSAGKFLNKATKINVWNFYHHNGQLSAKESYENGKIIKAIYYDENGLLQKENLKDSEAKFKEKNSEKQWENYLMKNLTFPTDYEITNRDNVLVEITFAINEKGEVIEEKVETSFHPVFNQIALDIIKKSSKWFSPMINHNRKLKSYHIQAVKFRQKY